MILTIIAWALLAVCLTFIVRNGLKNVRPALIGFAVIMTILFLCRPLILFFGLSFPFPQSHFPTTDWNLSALALLVGLIWSFFTIAFYSFMGSLASYGTWLLPSGPHPSKKVRPKFLWAIVLPPFLFCAFGTFMLIVQFGGFSGFVYASKVGKELKGQFIFQAAAPLTCMLAIYATLASLDIKANVKRLSFHSWCFIAIFAACCALNFTWGNRYNIATMILTFMFSWHFYVKNLKFRHLVTISLASAALLQSLRLIRTFLLFEASGASQTGPHFDFWLQLSQSLHFVEFDAFMLALRDTGSTFDFRQGLDFKNGLLAWIPRSIYPEKESFHIGWWFAQVYYPWLKNGWPITTVGAWYVNFGVFGILLGAAVSGLFMRIFDKVYHSATTSPWHAAIGFGLVFLCLEIGVNTGFPQSFVLYIFPTALASIFLRSFGHSIKQKKSN